MDSMSSEEFMEISRNLEKYHAIFYKLWSIGRPIFDENTPTAYVQFDEFGEVLTFGINKKFWKECSKTKKLFVVCHECLHILYNHGVRIGKNEPHTNKAADIVVNHELIRTFQFKREDINGWEDLCWIDTLFDKKDKVEEKQSLEYYYNLLKKNKKQTNDLVDDHNFFGGGNSDSEDAVKNILKKVQEKLSNEEINGIQDNLIKNTQAGTSGGNIWKTICNQRIKPKRKWETVIKNWSKKQIKNDYKHYEQWARTNRRFVCLSDDLIIPTEMEVENYDLQKNKISVWFFLDTSGSCYGYAQRFWNAAKSLPKNKFDINLFCFDTRVYKLDIKQQRLYGFGGTSFNIIESYIQKHSNKKYPKAVFIITDGYGNNVHPKNPSVWHWFLTTNCRTYIPKQSKVFYLKDFE